MDVERQYGNFPQAIHRDDQGKETQITTWCTNDYLAMGQNSTVVRRMREVMDLNGSGSGGTRNIGGTTHQHVILEK